MALADTAIVIACSAAWNGYRPMSCCSAPPTSGGRHGGERLRSPRGTAARRFPSIA
jgi:hypothetical protein